MSPDRAEQSLLTTIDRNFEKLESLRQRYPPNERWDLSGLDELLFTSRMMVNSLGKRNESNQEFYQYLQELFRLSGGAEIVKGRISKGNRDLEEWRGMEGVHRVKLLGMPIPFWHDRNYRRAISELNRELSLNHQLFRSLRLWEIRESDDTEALTGSVVSEHVVLPTEVLQTLQSNPVRPDESVPPDYSLSAESQATLDRIKRIDQSQSRGGLYTEKQRKRLLTEIYRFAVETEDLPYLDSDTAYYLRDLLISSGTDETIWRILDQLFKDIDRLLNRKTIPWEEIQESFQGLDTSLGRINRLAMVLQVSREKPEFSRELSDRRAKFDELRVKVFKKTSEQRGIKN